MNSDTHMEATLPIPSRPPLIKGGDAWVIIFSCINIFIGMSIVPKFEQIFKEMLAGQPLPMLTSFVIWNRMALIALAVASPLIVMALRRFAPARSAATASGTLAVAAILQLVITIYVLFMPLTGIIQTMPQQAH